MRKVFILLPVLLISIVLLAQTEYPYPVHYFQLAIEHKKAKMAFMDIKPTGWNKQTILLFHGKNFNGYYWRDVIPFFTGKGYRVIVPDQVGWGKSDKPDLHYSFHMLARNNLLLLDSLQVEKVIAIGHSMGGMLATRFTLLYPGRVEKLVLENPIGLEDYRTFVPYQPLDSIFLKEKSATYESYKKYQQSYYPEWKQEYEQYVKAQADALHDPAFDRVAWVNALTYQMIYEQPVVHEMKNIRVPALLIIGQLDRTIVGKALLTNEQKNKFGQYPKLGKKIKQLIPGARLVELPGVGHIPHIPVTESFNKAVLAFL